VSVGIVQAFAIEIAEATLADLHERLARNRWPAGQQQDAQWRDGPEPAYLRTLMAYWRRGFDWRAQERELNRFDQVRIELDGTWVHAVHQRGRGPRPLPLVLTHGWPSTFAEFRQVIGPLSDPAAFGGDAVDAFDVVVPSLLGFAFSDPLPAGTGFGRLSVQTRARFPREGRGYGRFMAAEISDAARLLVGQLSSRIADERVLAAIGEVPRDRFVPDDLRSHAWANAPLPIGEGQTISQPLVVARMCELLELTGDETVLDVGTGSGYHAAVLAQLARRVVSIERHASLSESAARNLRDAGVENVELVVGDGSEGHPPSAPYDAINVAAASSGGIPVALQEQLAPGGRLVIPTDGHHQRLTLVRRSDGAISREAMEPVRFVPLVPDADPHGREAEQAARSTGELVE
jgi:protein-L-isoaspartate(D-aspartate) O-methyltransferase